MKRILLNITGASGVLYGIRTLQAMIDIGVEVYVIASSWAQKVIEEETGQSWKNWCEQLKIPETQIYHSDDMAAAPSSGSFPLDATVIAPCSMASLGAIASGDASNLIHRSALVSLKEGRPLIIVPRETPLSLIDLKNMVRLSEAGACILPASPAFYHHPDSVQDMIDFVAGKILSRLGIDQKLFPPWHQGG